MYRFVYWFFYKYFIWKKGFESSFLASSMVGLTFIFHLILILSIIMYTTGWKILEFLQGFNYSTRKLIMIPFTFLFFWFIDLIYFKRKKQVILGDYEKMNPFSIKSISSIILLLIMPLILGIWLFNRE